VCITGDKEDGNKDQGDVELGYCIIEGLYYYCSNDLKVEEEVDDVQVKFAQFGKATYYSGEKIYFYGGESIYYPGEKGDVIVDGIVQSVLADCYYKARRGVYTGDSNIVLICDGVDDWIYY
ncbi:MAG: hypothetical protein EZS28_053308, partial [Streblomastix strix]